MKILHKLEKVLAAPRRVCLRTLDRAFMANYKRLFSFSTGDFKACRRAPQNGKCLYHFLCTADTHRDLQLVSCRCNALRAPLYAMGAEITRPVKVQNCESHKASKLDTESLFATLVRGIGGHDDEKAISYLLETSSHERAEDFHSYGAFKTHQSSVCEKWRNERGNPAQHTRSFDQGL